MKGLKITNCRTCPYSSDEDKSGRCYCSEAEKIVNAPVDVSEYYESIFPDCPLPDTFEDFAIEVGSGLDLIIKERERQISEEGWTPEHDKEHTGGELAVMAACYAVEGYNDGNDAGVFVQMINDGLVEDGWPDGCLQFDKRHKHDIIRRLTIAGALLAAELDRVSS